MQRVLACAAVGALAVVAVAAPALAHVTVQPSEAVSGSFSRFVVRVPNEEEKAATTKVEVDLPPMAFVSFQPKEGWTREIEMVTLDEPLEVFGNEITEVVGTVTWSGGSIEPGEFDEFGFSAAMPEEETSLEFPALQTYDDGTVVEWTGPPDAGEPAALVSVVDIGAGEGEGELAVLAELQDQVGSGTESDDAEEDEDEEESSNTFAVALGGVGVLLGAVALAVAGRKS
jgi:uncharacterized protein YcnI